MARQVSQAKLAKAGALDNALHIFQTESSCKLALSFTFLHSECVLIATKSNSVSCRRASCGLPLAWSTYCK